MINKLLAGLLLMTTVVIAQPGHGFRAVHPGLDNQLKLTPQQVEQIQKLRTAFQTKAIDLRSLWSRTPRNACTSLTRLPMSLLLRQPVTEAHTLGLFLFRGQQQDWPLLSLFFNY